MIDSLASIEAVLARAREALVDGSGSIALRLANEVLGCEPRHAGALHVLGLSQATQGDYTAAAESIERALEIDPDQIGWRRDLGSIWFALGNHERAECCLASAVDADPGAYDLQEMYGRVLLARGRYDAALTAFQKARGIDVEAKEPVLGIAEAQMRLAKYGDAAAACRELLSADPDNLDALRLLGEICLKARQHQDAREILESLLRIKPDDPGALGSLVLVCWRLGDLESTLGYARTLVATGRATATLHAFYLYLQLHAASATRQSIRQTSEIFGRTLSPVWRSEWPRNGIEDPDRKLRIGYLTGEFIHGPAFFFLTSLIGNHDQEAVEVYCYHTREIVDAETSWYEKSANWRDCRKLDDDAIVKQIRLDGIDVLVDLSAFFPENRLSIFARRAAPVQATYPNCPTTTGVGNVDYIFTDRWTCPVGCEDQYTEEPFFLPSGYLVYSPPEYMPPVQPLPALRNGWITFGMFQRRTKTNAAVWDAVAAVLRGCPNSRLLLQTGAAALDHPGSQSYREVEEGFARRGITRDRLLLAGKRSHDETLGNMSECDIALDTFPYQGQTTTCECLWMGLPVVALAGEPHVARVGTALLERAGLGHLSASSPPEYVEVALGLAGDIPALADMRQGMRERLRRSPLMDGRRLAADVESAYRWMWQRWVRGEQRR